MKIKNNNFTLENRDCVLVFREDGKAELIFSKDKKDDVKENELIAFAIANLIKIPAFQSACIEQYMELIGGNNE